MSKRKTHVITSTFIMGVIFWVAVIGLIIWGTR